MMFQISFTMTRDWQRDLDYSELVYSFVLRRKRRAKAIWEEIAEKGLPSSGGWNDREMCLLKRLQQWVRSSLSYKRLYIIFPFKSSPLPQEAESLGCITETINLKLGTIYNSECSALTNLRYWYEGLLALMDVKPVFGDDFENLQV